MGQSHEHKTALITGAARGLGRVFALALANQGCDVAIADILDSSAVADEIESLGRKSLSLTCDLSNPQQVIEASRATLEAFGRCDILINNAAYMPVTPFTDLELANFKRFEAINVEAPFLLAQQLTPSMVENGYGRILQIASSTTGTPMPGFLAYVTTKMAGIGLTRALAAEFGSQGVLCNALSPGLTATDESINTLPPELFESVRDLQLIKRTEVPEDLVGAMLFLTSEQCGFVNGQTINCDGGVNF